jgi:hypothetical protein
MCDWLASLFSSPNPNAGDGGPNGTDGGTCADGGSPPCTCCAQVAIKELAFTGNNKVDKDTLGPFPSPEWLDGRAQTDQSPVSYVRNTQVAFTAKFKVTTGACKSGESIEVKGTATFGSASLEWTGSFTLNPGATEASVALTSNKPLPNEVGIFESTDITWQMNPCNQGWSAAGTTRNVIYVTLDAPSGTPNYWTLLDISCRAATGKTTAPDVIRSVFTPLTSRSLSRKRDGHDLTYWNPPGPACSATSTALVLAAANGAGQCGSWAEFLIDIYKTHGITSGDKILIVRSVSAWRTASEGFLVKHWVFDHPPASSGTAYTHYVPSQCRPGAGLPGQRNPSPPPGFFNHFIVQADGKLWDPSYGAGPFADKLAWENAAIDGLSRKPPAPPPPPPPPAPPPPGLPAGTLLQTGFDKSLNAGANILEYWNLTTSTQI